MSLPCAPGFYDQKRRSCAEAQDVCTEKATRYLYACVKDDVYSLPENEKQNSDAV